MRYTVAIILFSLAFLSVGCDDSRSRPSEMPEHSQKIVIPADDTTRFYDSVATHILSVSKPGHNLNPDFILDVMVDSSRGIIRTAGVGYPDKSLSPATWSAMSMAAARRDASRRALIAKAILTDNQFKNGISGKIHYSTTLHEQYLQDSAIILQEIPVGSIVLKK